MAEPDDENTILHAVHPTSALPQRDYADAPEPDVADTVIREPAASALAASEEDPEADADAEDEAPLPVEPLHFRISNGSAHLVLDDDLHIGRNPRPPGRDRGTAVRLLRVESPSGIVSSSHLGLRRVGSTAVAADLMSTNGTLVFLPGAPPRRLRQGESVVAPPGTRLEIGEGIVIEVIRPSALG